VSTESIINQLKAETVLHGSWLLDEIKRFSSGITYADGDEVVSYKTFYNQLLNEVNDLPSLSLQPVIAPGTSRAYLIDLTSGLENVLDHIEVSLNKVLFFHSKVKSATSAIKNLRDTFKAWYLIGLQEDLKRMEIKLSNKSLEALSDSEFTRMLGESGSDLEALDMALVLLADRLKSRKKLSQEKYNIGKDQANASLLPLLGQAGYLDGKTGEELLRDKYGLGERGSLVMDDPPEGMRIASKRSMFKNSDPAPVKIVEEGFSFATIDMETEMEKLEAEMAQAPEETVINLEEEPEPGMIFEPEQTEELEAQVEASVEVPAQVEEEVTILTVGRHSKRKTMFDDEEEIQDCKKDSEPESSTQLTTPTLKKRRIVFDD
jgi:hypothetical protein